MQPRSLPGGLSRRAIALACFALSGWIAIGCRTESPRFETYPPPSQHAEPLRVGDTVTITFSGMDPEIPAHQEIIREDGTITLPDIGKSIVAAGKTSVELQKELLAEYQKKYRSPVFPYPSEQRYYYVTGEVTRPGPQLYLGETTLVQAIAAAGGPSEIADKRDILLRRVGRKPIHINFRKALEGDPKHNLLIAPGDTILMERQPQ